MLSRVSLCSGFLCSGCLQTKHRCIFCLCLIIIRGAQLSSAPLLTLFSQHYWSVLSRLHWQNRHVHIQIHYLVTRKQSLDLIPEMKAGKNTATPRWTARKMDFNLEDCCHQGYDKELRSMVRRCFCFVLVSCVKQQSFVLSGRRQYSADIAQFSTSCSLN